MWGWGLAYINIFMQYILHLHKKKKILCGGEGWINSSEILMTVLAFDLFLCHVL
jgi:hypothetical protein